MSAFLVSIVVVASAVALTIGLLVEPASLRRWWDRLRGRGPRVPPMAELERAATQDWRRREAELRWLVDVELERRAERAREDERE